MGIDYKPPEFTPSLVLLFNGKRKSGKDYFVELLQKRLAEQNIETGVMRIAEPIKYYWAEKHSLDFEKLLGTSEYKEQHRFEMVKWSMEVRAENYGYFCFEAIRMANAVGKPLWICVDMRHGRDYEWFLEFYSDRLKRIKVKADEDVRKSRGWKYTAGVDDGPSECDLDHINDWDLVVTNNGSEDLDSSVDIIFKWVQEAMAKN